MIHSIRLMLMFTEIRLVEDYNLRDVYIVDMKNVTFDHVKHITFTVIKRIETCFLVNTAHINISLNVVTLYAIPSSHYSFTRSFFFFRAIVTPSKECYMVQCSFDNSGK